MRKALLEIAQYDESLEGGIGQLKSELGKVEIQAFKSRRGLLESELIPRAPAEAQLLIEYGKYAAVFILSAIAAGFFGQAGANAYASLEKSIVRLFGNRKVNKDILLVVSIDRKRDFPLRVGFSIPHNRSDVETLAALNTIPAALKTVASNLDTYKGTEVIIVQFVNQNWDLQNVETRKLNHGSKALAVQRTMKLYGMAPYRSMPEEKKEMTLWEYENAPIPEAAYKAALNFRSAYYQRLYTKEEIKDAIFNLGAVGISMDIFDSFLKAPKGKIPIPQNGERKLGQHSVAAGAYNEEDLCFVNSWGAGWGDNGRGYLPWEYVDKYVFEAWGHTVSWDMLAAINLRNFWRPKAWLSFIKNKKEKKLVSRGSFKDKRGFEIKYVLYSVKPINWSNGGFFMLNLDSPKTKRTMGWLHFSCKDDEIWIEDIFVDKDNRNVGWGSAMLGIVSEVAASWNIRKIKGWVPAEDCADEYQEKTLVAFLERNKFSIHQDSTKFRGCLFRVEKSIS